MTRAETVYNALKHEFELSGNVTVWEDSDTAIKLKVVASEIARLLDIADDYQNQIFPATASREFLEKHGEARGVLRKPATKATGTVVFYCKGTPAADILIKEGTMLSSSKAGEAYQTTEDLTIQAGSASGIVPVVSVEAGRKTNLAPNYIDTVITPITGIERVTNLDKISGGLDQEDDEAYRKRVVEGYKKLTNGANLSYYEEFAKKNQNVYYAKAVFNAEASNEIFVYVQNFDRTITDAAIAELQSEIETVKEAGLSVVVKRAENKIVPVTLFISIDNLANGDVYKSIAEDAVEKSFNSLGIGQRISPAKICRDLLKVDGILDVRIANPSVPIAVSEGAIAGFSGIIVNVEREGA